MYIPTLTKTCNSMGTSTGTATMSSKFFNILLLQRNCSLIRTNSESNGWSFKLVSNKQNRLDYEIRRISL